MVTVIEEINHRMSTLVLERSVMAQSCSLVRLFYLCRSRLQNRIAFLILLNVAFSASAQQFINPQFSHFTINDGLSQSLIYCIAQDRTGFMWFGTKDGLNRFDGYDFKTFHHDPFDSSSISDNAISSLYSDSKGRLWIGTTNGRVDLYDSRKNTFSHFLHDNANKGNVNAITEDPSGNIWIGTYGNGIFKLVFTHQNRTNKPDAVLHYVNRPDDPTTINNNLVIDVFVSSNGKLWVSTTDGFFQYALLQQSDLNFITPEIPITKAGKKLIPQGIQYSLTSTETVSFNYFHSGGARFVEDQQHRIWMGSTGGLFLFDQKTNQLIYFDPLMPGLELGNVRSICNSSFSIAGNSINAILMGFLSGAGIMNTKDFTLQFIKNDPGSANSLAAGSILCVYQDRSGCLWLGSSGSGLSKFDTRSALFPMPVYRTMDGSVRIEDLSIRSFLSMDNILLIGTQTGLMRIDKNTATMQAVKIMGIETESNLVFNMIPAKGRDCWLATNNGLILYNYLSHTSKLFLPEIKSDNNVDNRIYKLYNDKQGNLWCLTPYSLSLFNTAFNRFSHYFFNNGPVNRFTEPTYGDIYQEPSGNIWLGTGEGLLYFDMGTKKFSRYVTNASEPNSLSFNAVRTVLPDPKNPGKYLWIATAGGGLNKMDLLTKKFTHYTERNGLPNNVVYGILTDENGNLWMSTNKGISMFNPSSQHFTNYNVNAGLQSNEFNSGAFYKDNSGILYFGGINGFNNFSPANIRNDNYVPQLAFTGFSLFNRPVTVGEKGSPLINSITETNKITLPYYDNIISFQVAALDFSDPEKNEYAYRLIPSNKSWVQMGSNRLITFSNLAPGNYTLQVIAGHRNGAWNEKGISLNLIILPPWWRTWWAFMLYFFALGVLLYLIRKYELKRVKLKNRFQVEHMEALKLKELDHLKSRFFANISHEFRTPLTLILGPVEDLLKTGDAEQFKRILPEVHRNSKRLLQLINQLLDLSKLDAKKYRINTTREDIIPFSKQIVSSFESHANKKNIDLQFDVDQDLRKRIDNGELTFYFDEDMIEKIINNLLSNAFKFTENGGRISVGLKSDENNTGFLELSVKDTGIGIPADKLAHIFDRFFQVDDSDRKYYEGSGVGLALLKELVDLLQGRVVVESEVGKGTSFYCYLPFNNKIITQKNQLIESDPLYSKTTSIDAPEPATLKALPEDKSKGLILIVEDHPDVRQYIIHKLKGDYAIIEADNGIEGLKLAQKEIPDLVISDVMMPQMDGFQLCEKLKTNHLTSHIPVVLLTARAEESDRMAGLEFGADAYLVKPFNSYELNIRVRKLIELRKKLRIKFSNKLIIKANEITVTPLDQEFMKKLMSTVETHISDTKFSVTQLSSEMNMSVSQLSRKLKALTDQSPQKLIRSIRMQRALELLKKNAGNISEISWEVGFEDPSYFSKVFKSHFGCMPSEKEKLP